MGMTGHSYSSGEWLVREGSEEEFIEARASFIERPLDYALGAESFALVRSTEDPRKFPSLGAWEGQEAQEAWREMPRMQVMLGQCRALRDEFDPHRYTLAANPGRKT